MQAQKEGEALKMTERLAKTRRAKAKEKKKAEDEEEEMETISKDRDPRLQEDPILRRRKKGERILQKVEEERLEDSPHLERRTLSHVSITW